MTGKEQGLTLLMENIRNFLIVHAVRPPFPGMVGHVPSGYKPVDFAAYKRILLHIRRSELRNRRDTER